VKRLRWLSTVIAAVLCVGCFGSSDDVGETAGFTSPSLTPNGIAAEVARLWQINNLDLVRYDYEYRVEVEEQIRVCMAELGFEYFPAPASRPLISTSEMTILYEAAAELHPNSAEFREAYGYGISTLEAYLHVARPLSTEQIIHEDGLSDAHLRAYSQSLWGSDTRVGCVESAGQDVEFVYSTTDEKWLAYNNALEQARERAMAVESYVAAEDDWAQCAHDLGYSYSRPVDVPLDFSMRLSEILVEPGDVEVLITGEPPPEHDIISGDGSNDSVYDPDVLAELQSEEISTALRLNHCDNAFVEDTQEVLNQLAAEELADTPFTLGS